MEPLYECPNQAKKLTIGRLFITSQWASSIWERDDLDGIRDTYYLKINKVDNGKQKALNIIVWKLCLYITVLEKK